MTGTGGAACEVCGAGTRKRDDMLCPDCSYAFTVLLELLHGHPDIEIKDLERIRRVFEWRMRKLGLAAPQPETVEEQKRLSSTLSVRSKRTAEAR
jgi:hypothetical protein